MPEHERHNFYTSSSFVFIMLIKCSCHHTSLTPMMQLDAEDRAATLANSYTAAVPS
jgi:hypothetical protein